MNLFSFLVSVGFWPALAQQVLLILLTVLLALAVGLPLGFASYKYHALTPPLIGLVNLLQTLPAFAVLGLGRGIRQHGFMMPGSIGGLGIGVMAGALTMPHSANEVIYTIIGVGLVALGHDLNRRALI